MCRVFTLDELRTNIQLCEERLKSETLDKHMRKILRDRMYRYRSRLNKLVTQGDIEHKEKRDKTKGKDDDRIIKEIYYTSTVKPIKGLQALQPTYYTCPKCGNETRERFAIDFFNLEEGFICKECNEKYYEGKKIKLLG